MNKIYEVTFKKTTYWSKRVRPKTKSRRSALRTGLQGTPISKYGRLIQRMTASISSM